MSKAATIERVRLRLQSAFDCGPGPEIEGLGTMCRSGGQSFYPVWRDGVCAQADSLARALGVILAEERAGALREVAELVKPQWRRIPVESLPDDALEAYVAGRNEIIDAVRSLVIP